MSKEINKKICKVRYHRISVSFLDILDGGGRNFGQDFIPVVKMSFGKVSRICEFGSGPGFIGFSLLAQGLCESLCLIDVNPEAVRICNKTVQENNLEDRVSIHLSDGLSDIPSWEKWDLVVSNPPHFKDANNVTPEYQLRIVDPNWNIHQQFYANVGKFLKPNGSVLFIENIQASTPTLWSEMIEKSGLKLMDCFWHKKFNTSRDAFFQFQSYKTLGLLPYYKKILKELLKPSAYPFYFVWSKKVDDKQRIENL